jgi:hypothetical protein
MQIGQIFRPWQGTQQLMREFNPPAPPSPLNRRSAGRFSNPEGLVKSKKLKLVANRHPQPPLTVKA